MELISESRRLTLGPLSGFEVAPFLQIWNGQISKMLSYARIYEGVYLEFDLFIKFLHLYFTYGQLKLNLKLKIFHSCFDKILDFLIRRIRTWSLTLNHFFSNLIYSPRTPPNCHVHKSVIPNQLFSSTIFVINYHLANLFPHFCSFKSITQQ